MRKIRTLIGMPVVVNDRRSGRVIQVELSDDLHRMAALWVDAGLRGTRRIPAEHLAMLGRVAVVADDLGHRCRLKAKPLFRRAVSTDGARLGAVTGAEIDELSFAVESLELSEGLWEDLTLGRTRIRSFISGNENGDVIVDAAEREEPIHEKWHDEGADYRCAHRWNRGDDVWDYELADRQADEPSGTQNRTVDQRQGR